MFKKNKKQTETIKEPKEKKVRTVKVGTHQKTHACDKHHPQRNHGFLMCAYLDSTHLFFFDIFCLFLILLKHNVILTFYCFTRPAPIKCCCQ